METHEKLRVRKSGAPIKDRKLIALESLGFSMGAGAFTSSLHNASLAIVKRVLTRKVPTLTGLRYVDTEKLIPDPGLFTQKMKPVFYEFKKVLCADSAPIAYEDFIGKYGGPKKRNYLAALEEFERVGFKPSHAHIRMFIKYEKDIRELKPDRIPRAISPAGFVYLLLTGVYIRAIEEKIYEAINTLFGYRVVAKGLNYDDLAKLTKENWDHFMDPVAFDLDVEKLDASIFSEALSWTHQIVGLCFPVDEARNVIKLLRYQLKSIVKGRVSNGSFRYSIAGTLTSGQMNTSLVGVLLVTSILFRICKKRKVRLTNMGDDCRLIVERSKSKGMVGELKEQFGLFNMFITCEKTTDLYRTEFCQTQIINIGGECRTVRKVEAALIKDSHCIDDIRAAHKLAAWMLAVGMGGLASHGGLPVFHAFYECLIRNANDYLKSANLTARQLRRVAQFTLKKKFLDWTVGINYQGRTLTSEARVGFFRTFGTTPVGQELIEGHYNKLQIDLSRTYDRDVLKNKLSLLL